eukprot:NODE_691_length_1508_cov_1341.809459_g486_i1.p1 GENE.NODE_691_length_1508_cov_1341.809459_g486_i1~~NODE_691_length_1508_cov_1341.809459_g486_i1.p1  ORF type:complete len:405 (+),score=75.99 NODE_691_length_1508_cov_1341.809459_g486_i1:40-1254(+)
MNATVPFVTSEMSVTTHAKFYLTGPKGLKEIRRIALPQQFTPWSTLNEIIAQTFKTHEYSLEYKDPEDDMVTMCSDFEWDECLRIGSNYTDVKNPLRLHVKLAKKKKQAELPHLQPEHFYTTGDCKMPDPEVLQGKSLIPAIIERYLPGKNTEDVPDWFKPACFSSCGLVDVNINALPTCLNRRAIDLMDAKRYQEALGLLRDAYAIQPSCATLYNIGCCHALMGNATEALDALENTVGKGYTNYEQMQTDEDLVSLHKEMRFVQLIESLRLQVCDVSSSSVVSIPSSPTTTSDPEQEQKVNSITGSNLKLSPETQGKEPEEVPAPVVNATPSPEVEAVPAHEKQSHEESDDEDDRREKDLREKFRSQLLVIHSMGFYEDDEILPILSEVDGAVNHAVERLLQL